MTGHAGKAGAAGLDHPLQHLVGEEKALVDDHRAACQEMRLQHRGAEGIVERQHLHRAVVRGNADGGDDRFGVGEKIRVREHHAARLAGRAGAEEDCRQVVATCFRQLPVGLVCELGQRLNLGAGDGRDLLVEHQVRNAFEPGGRSQLRFDEREAQLGPLDERAAVGRRQLRRDGHRHAAGAHGAEIAGHP